MNSSINESISNLKNLRFKNKILISYLRVFQMNLGAGATLDRQNLTKIKVMGPSVHENSQFYGLLSI